ncbi:glycoside hydrolase family 2 protein [Actinomadura alba]|uniref:beta-mannosidase n=1 Tax=Actinomadura alba TaxID=406431 RepID=A0ABR7M2P0_9ACTN|nr:glycoside hydrolase family 2 protein [Actinomadura alba]MBC6470980.1 glycoside hydrolase family 2 protein [Actinomadura alba]
MSSHLPLHGSWTLRPAGGDREVPPEVAAEPIPATVPGCVHTDLLAAGLILDPYLDDNELGLAWIGRTAWAYETTFTWGGGGGDRTDLVCAGLDTVATVELNGTVLGETANMHRSYRFAATSALRPGDNRLRVRFDAPYAYAERLRDRLGDRPGAYPEPYNFIRKMACNFGWDWGPTLVTSGIWRPIGLHSWSGARLAEVRPLVTVRDGRGVVTAHVAVERHTGDDLEVTVRVAGAETTVPLPAGATAAVAELEVADPELWWPAGYGDQRLYDLEVTLTGADGELDAVRRRVGFRDVRLDTSPDRHGSAFTIVVNDVPVFARGANWIPDDCFPSRIGRERYASRLGAAREAGLNLVRVWGGGLYESDDFYDECDELGLLVWQDFAFACAAYPEEEPFASEVEAEARENVARLASHPSLVLWCGNNENLVGHVAWGWQEELAGRTWGAGFYLGLLPKIVAELDPTRPYWPGSPYSGDMAIHPDEPGHGTMHIWDVWNRRDYTAYREYPARFAAEFGFQGPPAYATLRRALRDEPLAPDSPGLSQHQKAEDGNAKLAAGLAAHFPEPVTFDDWHYLTQLNQARALILGLEHFRSLWPVCAGTVIWQLNDCWPVTSWAAVDGDGRRKPLWYGLRRAYADRLLTVQPRDDGLALVAVNDTGTAWETTAEAARRSFAGESLAAATLEVSVPARGAVTVPLAERLIRPGDPAAELITVTPAEAEATADSRRIERATWFFAPDKDLALPEPDYEGSVEQASEGAYVTITARTLLRDVALFPDRLDPAAEVDDMLVTLLPGETARFLVRSPTPLDSDALLGKPVLRCVNDVVHATG